MLSLTYSQKNIYLTGSTVHGMIRYPQLYQAPVRSASDSVPTPAEVAQGASDWASLVDAIDAECPLLEEDTLAVIGSRPAFDAAAPLPEDTSALLPSSRLTASGVPHFIAAKRAEWDALYGSAFVRQVDPSEQFHSIPVAPRLGDRITFEGSDAPKEAEGIDFKALMYGESSEGAHRFDAAGMVMGDAGDSDEEDDLSPFGVPGRKQRRLERDANGRLLTPAEREAALRDLIATHKTRRLNAFFTNTLISSTAVAKRPDFNPILLVSPLASAPFQLFNIYAFLHDGHYVDPQLGIVDEVTGAPIRRRKDTCVTVSPGEFLDTNRFTSAFRRFDIYDDPSQLSPEQWRHVCGAIVTDEAWQFDEWFPNAPHMTQPSTLFTHIKGFLAFFEEDILPQRLREWRVHPVILTRKMTKAGAHISQAIRFWNELFTFLDSHEYFRQYSLKQ